MNQVPQDTNLPAPKIAFVQASWHADILESGYAAFTASMIKLSTMIGGEITVDRYDVPGAVEIPLIAKKLAATGKYAAIVGSAFVVDGGIYRHEFVAGAVLNGMMQVQLETGVPILSMVLTPQQFDESEERKAFFIDHFKTKGQEAAESCVLTLRAHESIKQVA
jgi:6,7-dimethyl-8-ribityllumazine synthase